MKTLVVCSVLVAVATGIMFGGEEEWLWEASSEPDAKCIDLAKERSCEFYKCFTKRFPCVTPLLDHGLYPTCKKMTNRKEELTPEGQQWLSNSRACFHKYLMIHYRSDRLFCHAFMDDTVNEYARCADSVQPNMCQIIYPNRRVIGQVLNITMDQLLENPRHGVRNIFGLVRMMSGCTRSEVRTYLDELKNTLIRALRREIRLPWD